MVYMQEGRDLKAIFKVYFRHFCARRMNNIGCWLLVITTVITIKTFIVLMLSSVNDVGL